MAKIYYIFSIVLFASVLLGAPTNETISEDGESTRILNGKSATAGQFKFQVSIQEKKSGGATSKFCGGVILNKHWILTAAHCFEGSTPSIHYRINCGVTAAYDYGKTSQDVKVKTVFNHPNYDPDTVANDIALLLLEDPLEFNKYVQPIELPPKSYEAHGEGTIMGWGAIDKMETVSSPDLLYAQTSVSTPQECKKFFEITNSQICLGLHNKNNACFGDSGGPFVQDVDGTLRVVGVTSYGEYGCDADKPIVYTKVTAFLDFIADTINKNSKGLTLVD